MHIFIPRSDVDLGPTEPAVKAGTEYVLDDLMAAQLMSLAGGGEMRSLDVYQGAAHRGGPARRMNKVGHQFESALYLRAGGFGDLILLTPVLREHKRQFPNARIGVATMTHYAQVLAGLPFVDEVVPYPLTLEQLYQWDEWVFLENAIERNPAAHKVHMTDLFAQIAGVGEEFDKRPVYQVKPSEAVWANVQHPRNQKRRLCVQVRTSAIARNYPGNLLGQACRTLSERGWEVFLMGEQGQLPEARRPIEWAVNLTEAGYSFRQSAAIINTADCVLAPDSALVHVAGALGVPTVALYGPFPWSLRTAYCPTTYALTGNGPCAPCFHHVNPALRDHFPKDCPTAKLGMCGVLADIKPERIVAKVDEHKRRLD